MQFLESMQFLEPMRFLRPDLAHWAVVLPLLIGLAILHVAARLAFRRRTRIAARFQDLSRRTTGVRDAAALVASLVAAGGLVFALVRPQMLLTHQIPQYQRQDLIIMLDRSVSMQAHDIRPSRAARAAREIRNFIRYKPEGIDRVALVGFADSAIVLSYLTQDVDSLLFYFDWIDQDRTPLFGTDIGAALTSALEIARKDDRPTQKLFLLLSDGEDYGTDLKQAVLAARAAGHRVNCIGIGSDDAVPIPLRGADGRETPLRDDEGHAVLTRFSETTLRQIAADTGGRYMRSSTGDDLPRALAGLASRERRLIGWRAATDYRDLYPLGLLIAAIAGGWLLLLL
jgi:Ca-activated chloride channel homolog